MLFLQTLCKAFSPCIGEVQRRWPSRAGPSSQAAGRLPQRCWLLSLMCAPLMCKLSQTMSTSRPALPAVWAPALPQQAMLPGVLLLQCFLAHPPRLPSLGPHFHPLAPCCRPCCHYPCQLLPCCCLRSHPHRCHCCCPHLLLRCRCLHPHHCRCRCHHPQQLLRRWHSCLHCCCRCSQPHLLPPCCHRFPPCCLSCRNCCCRHSYPPPCCPHGDGTICRYAIQLTRTCTHHESSIHNFSMCRPAGPTFDEVPILTARTRCPAPQHSAPWSLQSAPPTCLPTLTSWLLHSVAALPHSRTYSHAHRASI